MMLHEDRDDKLERARLYLCGMPGIQGMTHELSLPADCGYSLSLKDLATGRCEDINRITKSFGALLSDVKAGKTSRVQNSFVHTVTACRNLWSMAIALCQGRPVLLEGPTGSGKTALVEHLACVTGNSDSMIRVHLDDQMDSKTLIGSYVCTETPGEFVWKAGALTQAVEQVRGGPSLRSPEYGAVPALRSRQSGCADRTLSTQRGPDNLHGTLRRMALVSLRSRDCPLSRLVRHRRCLVKLRAVRSAQFAVRSAS